MIPDIKRIISDHLRTNASVLALNPQPRIVGKTPDEDKRDRPWVTVRKFDDPQVGQPDHLVAFGLQLDCYAGPTGGYPEANDLARTVRAALPSAEGAHPGGVVNGVKVLGGPEDVDNDFKPGREREMMTVIVWAHG